MSHASPAGRYTLTARSLHWAIGILVIGLILVGLSLDIPEKGSPTRDAMFFLHKSTGILVLILMIGRLAWRVANPPPAPEPGMPTGMQRLASANHYVLYALLFVMPVIGWAGSNAFGAPVSLYGLIPLPNLLSEDKEFAKQILALHGWLGYALAALIVVHVGAALYHRFVRHDGVLSRMA